MLKKLMASLLAITLAFGAVMTTNTAPAEAGRGGRVAAGIAAGIIGLGVLGAYAHARDRHYDRGYRAYDEVCYKGPKECGWVGRRCFENPLRRRDLPRRTLDLLARHGLRVIQFFDTGTGEVSHHLARFSLPMTVRA